MDAEIFEATQDESLRRFLHPVELSNDIENKIYHLLFGGGCMQCIARELAGGAAYMV